MRVIHVQTLAILLVAASLAGAVPSADQPWGFPTPVVVPKDMPEPVPAESLIIRTNQQLIVQFKLPTVLRAHPANLVRLTEEAGPIRVRGVFADGIGLIESRTYAGPCIWIIEPVSVNNLPTGLYRVELDAIPIGERFKSVADITTTTIQVEAGEGAIPPPKPKPDVAPVVTSFRVLFIRDPHASMTIAQIGVYDSQAVAKWLNENCTKDGITPGWRRYGKDQDTTGEFPDVRALWTAVRPKVTTVPCLVIEVNGKADIIDLPATEADAITTLKTYRGIK